MQAGLEDDEIKTAMEKLKDKTPGSVYEYLDLIKKNAEEKEREAEEAKVESTRKYREALKRQEEFQKNHLKRVKAKIAAVQDENRKRDEEFDEENQKGYDDVVINEPIRIRIFVQNEKRSIWVGFDKEATTKDLFDSVKKEYTKSFKLTDYYTGAEVVSGTQMLSNIFPNGSGMLEIDGTLQCMEMPKNLLVEKTQKIETETKDNSKSQ